MKNIYLIICLFIFSYTVTAQNQSIDSLKKVLKTASQDTIKVNALNNISTAFIQIGHFDSANRYTKLSIYLVEKLRYPTGAIMAFHNIAAYNFHIKEYKIGKFFLLKSLDAALLTNDKKNIAADYKELADLYQLQSNFKQAKESNRKFVLYSDSLAKEESAKHTDEIDTVANIKEKVDLIVNNTDKNITAVNDNQKQTILYLLLGGLLILLVCIIWLIRNKTKKDTILSEENAKIEQNKIVEKPLQLKDTDIDNAAFLQKINEIETLIANNITENKEVNEKPVIEKDFKEGTVLDEEEITIKKTNTETNNVEAILNELGTKSEAKQEPIDPTKVLFENNTGNIKESTKTYASAITDNRYSKLIFSKQLPHFTAKVLEDTVKLLWKTNEEKKIARFEVEKSADGVQYVTIETHTAKGFGSNIYETIDFKPLPGLNYYRLEIIDLDDNFIYSPVVQVEVLPVTTLTLICYPTHVKDVIMVTAAGGKLSVLINIYNIAGQKEFTIETPPTTTPIYLTSLATGTYTLQMKCQGKTILQQLIKN